MIRGILANSKRKWALILMPEIQQKPITPRSYSGLGIYTYPTTPHWERDGHAVFKARGMPNYLYGHTNFNDRDRMSYNMASNRNLTTRPFATQITATIAEIPPHCINLCTWVPQGYGSVDTVFALKYPSRLCWEHGHYITSPV